MLISFKDGGADFADSILTLDCAGFHREIDFSLGYPRTLQICFNGKKLAGESKIPDTEFPGLEFFQNPDNTEIPEICSVHTCNAPIYDSEAVYIEVDTYETGRKIRRLYRYILRPGIPGHGIELELKSSVIPSVLFDLLRNVNRQDLPPARMDSFRPVSNSPHCRSWCFKMRTDINTDLVQNDTGTAARHFCGNVFQTDSLLWIQEAPPSEERREWAPYDFSFGDGICSSYGTGFTPAEIMPQKKRCSWRHVILAITNSPEKSVRDYLRSRGAGQKKDIHRVTINPWGSGHFPEQVNTAFLKQEFLAGKECGADIYQIDDGYEQGGSLGTMIHRNRPADRNFWNPDTVKFPKGFAEVIRHAQTVGLDPSLWFAPGFNKGFTDWEESADILLNLWHKYNIRTFKLDGVIFSSADAEENFRALLQKLFLESSGAISINLDVTYGMRGGVFEFSEFGSIFLENRYLNHPSVDYVYDPEETLRHLWNLSHWIPTGVLQIEAPSPEGICDEAYSNPQRPDRPDRYSWEFMLGITLFANPLLWFSPSLQSVNLRKRTAVLLNIRRQFTEELHQGDVYPIGEEPGNKTLTGFYSEAGYAIVFRTLQAKAEACLLPSHSKHILLYSSASADLRNDGTVTLTQPGSFAIWKILD